MSEESPKSTNIDTGGGSSIGDGVSTGGGNFVGRDHTETNIEIKEAGTVHVYSKKLENAGLIWAAVIVVAGIILGSFVIAFSSWKPENTIEPIVPTSTSPLSTQLPLTGISSSVVSTASATTLVLPTKVLSIGISGPLMSTDTVLSKSLSSTPVAAATSTDSVKIEQIRISGSQEYSRLDVTIKNPLPYDVLMTHMKLIASAHISCSTCLLSSIEYTISDTVIIRNTESSLSILGTVREGSSPFYYPVAGIVKLGSNVSLDTEFETSLLVPKQGYLSFNILVPNSLKITQIRKNKVSVDPFDVEWLLSPSHFHDSEVSKRAVMLKIYLDSQYFPITTTLNLP